MTSDKKFEWNDQLVLDFHKSYMGSESNNIYGYMDMFKASHSIDVTMEKHNYKLKRDYNTPEFSFPKGTLVARIGKDYYAVGNQRFSQKQIEESTEWFESIDVGRDGEEWQVESFRSHKNPVISWDLQDNGKYKNNYGIDFNYEELMFPVDKWHHSVKSGEMFIHSVLRKSDNSLWTVLEKTNYGIIEKFYIGWSGIEVHFTNGCGATLASLSKLPPERSKLFTTEDGVDVFEGDKAWWINHDWRIGDGTFRDAELRVNYKYFSTRDKAIEYCALNKKLFSVNDVAEVGRTFPSGYFIPFNDTLIKLKDIAQTKIKL